ncbi:MAG: UDP-N-acetylmuramoyl-tripeptide--D-alanyl-D-alanine ligase [Lachnospiraceae bacterium]|nr:UDP-N-acetylmuramoyl-tripeptide--D-alanyl-D-alanine ligase [Lachnospiraceae bacterium]
MELTVKEIADMMGGCIISGNPETIIKDFSLSSKEGGEHTLFLPVVGERVDAHNFIKDAMEHGMTATLTERGKVEEGTEAMTYISVDNTLAALQRMGAAYRCRFDVKCVAITGSVGKTSTKEMIATALSASLKTVKTEGNKNGQFGVPLMVMKLEPDTECLVLENGVSIIGEMEKLSAVTQPDIAVVTNIGYSHVGNFGSRSITRREKLGIIDNMDEEGTLLLNGDDELLSELLAASPTGKCVSEEVLRADTLKAFKRIKVCSYGTGDWCDYKAVNVTLNESGSEFEYVSAKNHIGVSLQVPGKHSVLNAIAALACAERSGADVVLAAKALNSYRQPAMRGNVEWLKSGICLIDDSYNASPDSVKSGLNILSGITCEGRKIAVLGDMLELGDYSEKCHRLAGESFINSGADILVAVGKESAATADEVTKNGQAQVYHFEERKDAEDFILGLLKPGDCIILKGSRGMQLDETVKLIRERFK